MQDSAMRNVIIQDISNVLAQGTARLDQLKNSLIVVTGGTGFIGTWLIELLIHLNDQFGFGTSVIAVARGNERWKTFAPHLLERRDVKFLRSDIRSLVEFPRDCQWIIHAAATPDNRFHASNPIETMSVIGEGTLRMVRLLEPCASLKRVAHVSSGITAKLPFVASGNVNSDLMTASSAYQEAKRYSEVVVASARSQIRAPIFIVRPYTFIGPYQSLDKPWALNGFIDSAVKRMPIRVLGNGLTERSYLYASDMAYWLLCMLVGSQAGDVFDLGNAEAVSLVSLANLVARQVSPNVLVELNTANQSISSSSLVPEISPLQKKLGLNVTVSLEEAIARTISWHFASSA